MALHDTESMIVESTEAAPSLPNPATVTGRSHELCNTAATAATWTSTGATPFLVHGVAAATLTVAAGGSARVTSNGTAWVLVPHVGQRMFAATAATASNGQAVFTFSPPFPSPPVVSVTAQPGALGANGHFAEVLSVTVSSCTVQGWQGRGVLVGGQTTETSGSGVTMHLVATGPS